MLNAAEILREALPLTKEIRNCTWKRQQWQYRTAKLETAIKEFNAGKVIDWQALKISGLEQLIKAKIQS
jgi:hypothetical protein